MIAFLYIKNKYFSKIEPSTLVEEKYSFHEND
jgi:hypothetical protein